METDHHIHFSDTEIIASEMIQEHFTFNSLNGNTGSLMLKLW